LAAEPAKANMAAKAKAMSRWRFLLSHMAFNSPGADDSFEEKNYTTASLFKEIHDRRRHLRGTKSFVPLALASSKRFIRHPADADLVEAEIAVFGGFWQCQVLDRGSHALKPVTSAPRAREI
jgi:hypothetical protein